LRSILFISLQFNLRSGFIIPSFPEIHHVTSPNPLELGCQGFRARGCKGYKNWRPDGFEVRGQPVATSAKTV
jgi:hypothetical protein